MPIKQTNSLSLSPITRTQEHITTGLLPLKLKRKVNASPSSITLLIRSKIQSRYLIRRTGVPYQWSELPAM